MTPDLYPYSWGGIAVHTYLMSKYQANAGHTVTVLTVDDGNAVDEANVHFEVVKLRGGRDPLGNPLIPGLPEFLHDHSEDFDVVHLHSHLFSSSVVAAWSVPKRGPPIVLTCHGVRSAAVPFVLSDIYLSTVVRATLRRVHRILCYSDADARSLASITGTPFEKFAIVENGVPLETFKPQVPPRSRGPVLIWAGRMVRLKGLGTLLRAMTWIAKDFPNSRLKLVGDGPEIRHLRRMADELKLTANLQRISGVPFEKMPELYNDSKVCVVASKTEGMPRTLMESLACGVPVVASALPQLAEFEGRGVILVNPNSERELAEAVISILTHEKAYESLCRKARELAEERFDWKSTVSSTSRQFDEVLTEFQAGD